jgi:dephospho-CoA kinase/inosine/xanthosine triphosphate pyrophosphatase family protein
MQNTKHICSEYQINIKNFNEVTSFANYEEPRIYNREKLLEVSFENALNQLRKAGLSKKPFILEDTSVDIYALTKKYGYEFPGLDVKYWMKEAKLEDLDLELTMLGGDRSVTVRSDLILFLPGVAKTKFQFTGLSKGTVTKLSNNFETNVVYPWLDNKTFNKWFVPSGEASVLSMLPIEKADLHDFRRKAFVEMFALLKKYNLLKPKITEVKVATQADSFIDGINCHIVYGLSCAGKTTIATYLINKYEFLHIEASDFMHQIYREKHGLNSSIQIGRFAKEILRTTPLIVAERVLKYIQENESLNLIITGFRLPQEVEYIETELSTQYKINKVLLSADRKLRLQRESLRARSMTAINEEKLQERDERELEMGLAELVSKKSSNIEISNEKTLQEFYSNYCESLQVESPPRYADKKHSDFNLLSLKEIIIISLYVARGDSEKSDFFSTTEITNMINANKLNTSKFVTNVGRFFKMSLNELFEVTVNSGTRKYRLSNTGVGYAKLILRKFEFTS